MYWLSPSVTDKEWKVKCESLVYESTIKIIIFIGSDCPVLGEHIFLVYVSM